MVIITAGMIGVGKTTLTSLIAENFGTKEFYKPVGDNPVLPLYYSDPTKYGFLLQIYFFNRRFDQHKQALADDNNGLDRSIYEDALFTSENHKDGNITDAEMSVYTQLLNNMMSELQKLPKKSPDLLVYAETDFETILYRIKKRGRDYEQFDNNDDLRQYYFRIWSAYREWFDNYDASPKIKVDLQTYDLEIPENQTTILNQINDALKTIR